MTTANLPSRIFILCTLLASCFQPMFRATADDTGARTIRFVLEDEPFVAEVAQKYRPKVDLHYAAVVRGFAPLMLSAPFGDGLLHPLDGNGLVSIARIDSSPAGARLRKMTEGGLQVDRFKSMLIEDDNPVLAPPRGPHVAFKSLPGAVQELNNPSSAFRHRFWDYFFTPAREAGGPPLQQYALFAPSVEEAKQFADDFLHVYDDGFVPWLRKFVEEQQAALNKVRDEAEPKLAELDKKIAALGREVRGVEELGQQAISDLKVKRTLLKVELAGVKARISSIEEKLKDSTGIEQLRAKLVDLKVTADIDLASLAAQQKVLDELIDGQRRLSELAQMRQERKPQADRIQTAADGLNRCDEILTDLKPFQLVNETVLIRPLRLHIKDQSPFRAE